MKRLYAIAAALPLVAFAAIAQESPSFQIRTMGIRGGVMGKTVKGAPYSGTEVTETNQTLADGTRIHNETQTQVWRDSEGRVRRETGNEVMIYDPVASTSYSINTKTQTVRKLPLGTYMFSTVPDGSKTNVQYFRFSSSTDNSADTAKAVAEAQAKLMTAQTQYTQAHPEILKSDQDLVEAKKKMEMLTLESGRTMSMDVATGKVTARMAGSMKSLGKRMIEGVNADGTSETGTIKAGAIGNDRPIQTVSERWYSTDLQTVMMSKHSDPRTGDESFKLINVSRTEPPSYLFQIPAGFQMIQ